MHSIDLTVGAAADGKTCGDFLRSRGVSRRLIVKAKRITDGLTRFGSLIRTVDVVREGDVITLLVSDDTTSEPNGSLYASVVYEDENIVIFNKPVGMPSHPSAGHRFDTLGNLFAALYPGLTFRPINRLDKDTSGLCAVAKNAYAASVLNGKISKVYYAVTEGTPIPGNCGPLIGWYSDGGGYVINAPIGRAEGTVIRREVRADGRPSVTRYAIVNERNGLCLAAVTPETGRTHQIRVHFSAVGHPLAGDGLYGGGKSFCQRQALHCAEMRFKRVSDGKEIAAECPVPEDMRL